MNLIKSIDRFIEVINEAEKTYNFPGDKTYIYRVYNGKWEGQKVGSQKWFSMERFPSSIEKLNKEFPNAIKSKSSSKTQSKAQPKSEAPKKFSKEEIEKAHTEYTEMLKKKGEKKKYDPSTDPFYGKSKSQMAADTGGTRDTFNPYAHQTKKDKDTAKVIQDKFNSGFVNSLKKSFLNVKPHVRIFLDFLGLRKNPVTEKDFTKDELQTLQNVINHRKVNGRGTEKFVSGKNFDFYSGSNDYIKAKGGSEKIKWGDKNFGVDQKDPSEISTQLAFVLGNAKVTEGPNYYLIQDQYDFNNYYNDPEKYTKSNYPSTVKNAIEKLKGDNYVQGIEEIVSVLHKKGYKGIPVNIKIPKNVGIQG